MRTVRESNGTATFLLCLIAMGSHYILREMGFQMLVGLTFFTFFSWVLFEQVTYRSVTENSRGGIVSINKGKKVDHAPAEAAHMLKLGFSEKRAEEFRDKYEEERKGFITKTVINPFEVIMAVVTQLVCFISVFAN